MSFKESGVGLGYEALGVPIENVGSIKETFGNLSHLRKFHREKLSAAKLELQQLEKFRTDYEHLRNRLITLPNRTTYEIMVPFGSLALMPGKLIHTNEVMVLLGDNWFAERSAKQAQDIVNRRIRALDEKIKSCQKVLAIHKNWLEEADRLSADMTEDQVEIIETITEEQYLRSKAEKRPHLTPSKWEDKSIPAKTNPRTSTYSSLSISNVSDTAHSNIKSHENVLRRLEELELQEAAMEELESKDSLHNVESSSADDSMNSVGSDFDANEQKCSSHEIGTVNVLVDEKECFKMDISDNGADDLVLSDLAKKVENIESVHKKSEDTVIDDEEELKEPFTSLTGRRVSWAEGSLKTVIPDDTDPNVKHITYIPSKTLPEVENRTRDKINTPADIYDSVKGDVCASPILPPRSILKNPSMDSSSFGDDGAFIEDKKDTIVSFDDKVVTLDVGISEPAVKISIIPHEKAPKSAIKSEEGKKVSQFKASRSKVASDSSNTQD